MKLFRALVASLLFCILGCRSTDMTGVSDARTAAFGNEKCPTSGEAIDPAAYLELGGQRIYFCCQKCAEHASADPAGAFMAVYGSPQPVGNSICPVSGEPVGEATATWQGHTVGLCCADCEAPFEASATEYTAKAAMTPR